MEQESKADESEGAKDKQAVIAELKARLEKELAALLAHPLVPEEFKVVFKENK